MARNFRKRKTGEGGQGPKLRKRSRSASSDDASSRDHASAGPAALGPAEESPVTIEEDETTTTRHDDEESKDDRVPLYGSKALRKLRQKQGHIGLTNQAAFAEGLTTLGDRDRLLATLLPAEVESSDILLAVSHFKKLDAVANWSNASAAPTSLFPETYASITRLPVLRQVLCTITQKNFRKSVVHANQDCLTFHRPGAYLGSGPAIIENGLGYYRYDRGGPLTSAQWQEIGDRAAVLLQHIPGNPFVPGQQVAKLHNTVTTVFKELHPGLCPPGYTIRRPAVRYGIYVLRLPVVFLRGGMHVEKAYRVSCNHETINMSLPDVPPLPAGTLYIARASAEGEAYALSTSPMTLEPEEMPSGADKDRCERSVRFLEFVSAEIGHAVFESRGAVAAYIQSLARRYVGRSHEIGKNHIGMYNGKPLCYLTSMSQGPYSKGCRLGWGTELLNDVFGSAELDHKKITRDTPAAYINLRSKSYSAVAPLLDTAEETFLSRQGLRATFHATARCADEINTALRDGTPLRDLVGPRSTGQCRCGQCGNVTHRDDITLEASLHLVCSGCREPPSAEAKPVLQLVRLITDERKTFTKASFTTTPREEARLIVSSLSINAAGESPDLYQPGAMRFDGPPRHNQRSFDAIFSSVRRSNGTKGLHTPDPLNVGPTSLWTNLAMHTSPPGMTDIYLQRRVVEHEIRAAFKESRHAPLLLEQLESIRQQEYDMHAVELQTEHTKAARLGGTISKAAWERLDHQRKSGKLLGPIPPSTQIRLDNYVKSPHPPRRDWLPGTGTDFQDRLKPLMDSIIEAGFKETGIKVPRGDDGCPFPGDEADMPAGWSYWTCWVWVGRRLIRLWLWCNGCFVCVICVETLFLTWLYCFAFGLRGVAGVTWNVRARHIRGLVFAHDRHGEQMMDYFPANSSTLSDLRDPAARNLRPETTFENYAVHNFDQNDPDATADIASQLDKIKIPKHLFDPQRASPSNSTLTDEDLVQADDDEDDLYVPGMGNDVDLDEEGGDDDEKPKKKGKPATQSKKKATKKATKNDNEGSASDDDDDAGKKPTRKADRRPKKARKLTDIEEESNDESEEAVDSDVDDEEEELLAPKKSSKKRSRNAWADDDDFESVGKLGDFGDKGNAEKKPAVAKRTSRKRGQEKPDDEMKEMMKARLAVLEDMYGDDVMLNDHYIDASIAIESQDTEAFAEALRLAETSLG